MASLIETYKSSNNLKYQTDLESVQELYKASKDYQENILFQNLQIMQFKILIIQLIKVLNQL